MEPPQVDRQLARQRDLRFQVTARDGRGKRWEIVEKDLTSLEEAIAVAEATERKHVSVWVTCEAGSGNMLYWTKEYPDLFHSAVLKEEGGYP